MSQASSNWNKRNPEKMKAASKRWREKNRAKVQEYRASRKEKRNQYLSEWRDKNREHVNEQAKTYYYKDAEKARTRSKNYRKQHIDEIKKNEAEYRTAHREERNKHAREYYHQNKIKVIKTKLRKQLLNPIHDRRLKWASYSRKLARKWGCKIGNIDTICEFYEKTLAISVVLCYYCGHECGSKTRLDIEVDHKTPLSRGGPHDVSNLVACCKECNNRKGSKTEEEFREYLSLLNEVREEINGKGTTKPQDASETSA